MFEFFLLSSFFTLSYLNLSASHRYKESILLIIPSLLILTTIRQFGYDLSNYYYIYSDIVAFDFTIQSLDYLVGPLNKSYEASFHLISHFSDLLGFGFRGLLFFYAFLTLALVLFSGFLSKVPISSFFSAYLLLAFLPGPYESIRSAIAILMSFIAILFYSNNRFILALVFFTVGFYFHKTILVLPLLYFIYRLVSTFKIGNKVVYIVLLFSFPLSILILGYIIEFLGSTQPSLISIYAILIRDGIDGVSNNTELLKYIIILGRCISVYFLVFFVNLNYETEKSFGQSRALTISLNIVNIMVFFSMSIIISGKFIIAARVVELIYLLVIFLVVYTIKNVKFRRYNLLYHVALLGLLGINIAAIFLMYLLPSNVPG